MLSGLVRGVAVVAAGVVGLGGVYGGSASAQDGAVFEMYFGGAERLFDEEKDAGLRRVWELAGGRLEELPAELRTMLEGRLEGIEPAVSVARRLRWSEVHLRVGLDLANETGWGGVTLWPGGGGDAAAIAGTMRGLMEGAGGGEFVPMGDGWWRGAGFADGERVFLGSAERAGGEAVVVALGGEGRRAGSRAERRGIFSGALNLRAWSMPDEMPEGARGLTSFVGVAGEDAWRAEWMVERAGGKLVARSRALDAREVLSRLGVDRSVTLDPESLRVVPRDAVWVAAFAYDLSGIPGVIERAVAASGASMEVFEENQAGRTAMGFVRSLTDTLGDDVVVYRSMTTGGGGLLSSVASVEVENERALNEWLTRTVAMGNGAGAAFLRGYATVVRREAGGRTLWSLRTTGLPLPLDVTVGVGGGRAFIGATSGAVMSAMDHASGGALSVLENAGFRRSMAPALRGDVGLVGVRWRDMAWHAERSYVIAEAFGVAAANAVRERFGGERDPGRVVPSYGAFMRDIDPAAGWTYWDGDDLVGYAESDGSLLVNLAVSAREAAWQQLLSGVPGLALPAFEQGRRTGMQIRERERMLEPAQPR